MNAFSPAQFRAQFPALADAGIYLDSAATALKPQAVIEATQQFYSLSAGNVHRSQFAEAQRLTARYEAARDQVARLINAESGKNIVWTRGTTEAINMVAQCYARPRLKPGDEIIVSEAEHHANLVPWLMVAEQTGARIVKLPLGADLLPDVARLSEFITPRSRILALGQMSNVTGGCPDLALAIDVAHANDMVVMVDGAQGVVHFPADVQKLDIDFYAFSGHKLYGPTGIGVLYGKPALLAQMTPWLGGGKMITEVTFEGFKTQDVPYRLEAGTPNVAGVIGLSAALEWLAETDIAQAERWSRVWRRLQKRRCRNVRVFDRSACRTQACWPLILPAFIIAIWLRCLPGMALPCVPASTARSHYWPRWVLAVHCVRRLRRIIRKAMWMRWLMPLTAPLKYWWINDEFSVSRASVWHGHHRRDLKTDFRPAVAMGR